MKFAVVVLAVTFLAAGPASAAERVSDVDFLRANRCKGLAAGLNAGADSASLDSFIKVESRARAPYVMERAAEEFQKARKQARSEDRKDRLTAEFNGACQAYLGKGADVSKQ